MSIATFIRNNPTCSVADALAAKADSGMWVPANGRTEVPFMCKGRRLLYCWNTGTGQHAYLDCDSDVILSDEEAAAVLP